MPPSSGFTPRLTPKSWPARSWTARTIITADLDYPHLLALARATEPSLILFRDGDWNEADVIARMGEVLASLTETEIGTSKCASGPERERSARDAGSCASVAGGLSGPESEARWRSLRLCPPYTQAHSAPTNVTAPGRA
jgi:hypothetical protein